MPTKTRTPLFAKTPADEAKAKIEARAQEIITLTTAFCRQHLDDEYAELCEKLVRKMGRKRAVPFVAGRTPIWAGAVIYALGQINFLFDPNQPLFTPPSFIASHFGTTTSSLGQKAKRIRDMFEMDYWDPEFSTQANQGSNPFANIVMVNGLPVPRSMLTKLGLGDKDP